MKKVFLALAAKAGVANDPAFKKFIAEVNEEGELSPELQAAITAAPVLTLDAAKEHPDVKSYFKAALFSQTDAALTAALQAHGGYTEDEIKALVSGKASPEKIGAAMAAISSKLKAEGTKDKTQREKELETAYKNLETEKAQKETELQKVNGQFGAYKQTAAIQGFLGSQKLRSDFNRESLLTLAESAIIREAEKQGAAVVYDEATRSLKLVSAADKTAPFYTKEAPTTPVDFAAFSSTVLDKEQLLSRQPAPGPAPTVITSTRGSSNPAAGSVGALMADIASAAN